MMTIEYFSLYFDVQVDQFMLHPAKHMRINETKSFLMRNYSLMINFLVIWNSIYPPTRYFFDETKYWVSWAEV